MPICYMPGRRRGKDESEDEASGVAHGDRVWATAAIKSVPAHQDWREPPGYLGEAVRRAKRISSRTGLSPASEPAPKDY
jgi:hypothetical protein